MTESKPIAESNNNQGSLNRLWWTIGVMALIIVGITVLMAAITFMVDRSLGEPREIVESQLVALKDGKIEEAYSFGSAEFKKEVPFEKFKEFVKANPEYARSKGITIQKNEAQGNLYAIGGTFEIEQRQAMLFEYRVILENNEWKIFSMSLNNSRSPEQLSSPGL